MSYTLDSVERMYLGYQALYHNEDFIDNDANEALREGLKGSFRKHDTLTSEILTEEGHRQVFAYGVELGAEKLQGKPLNDTQRAQVEQDIELFSVFNNDFYDELYDKYEARYNGETVDFEADNERYLKSIDNEESPEIPDPNELVATSGLSYTKPAPDVEQVRGKQEVRTYETVSERNIRIEHENIAKEMREAEGGNDKQYHEQSQERNPHKHFTAGDSFGFDEKDDDDLELG